MKKSAISIKSILLAVSAAAVIVAAVPGCANYRLGTTLDPALRDVYVPNVRNESGQPGVEIEVMRALIKEIQREGTLRIDSEVADFADESNPVPLFRSILLLPQPVANNLLYHLLGSR